MRTDRIDVLVDLVVTRAMVDRTAPDPQNLQNGWRTDSLLGDIDALVVGKHNDPAGYTEIGRRVLEKVRDLSEAEFAVLAQLAIFRGERLLPVNSKREQFILQIVKEIENAISALADGTRKMRCKSLFDYHKGIFYDSYGRFDLAVESHVQAAQEAERFGDRPGMAISRFMEIFYRLKEALLIDRSATQLEDIFSRMEERFSQLVEAMHGSILEVQWAEGNSLVHMMEACIWLNRNHSDWENWANTAFSAAKKLGKSWEPIMEFIRAVDLANRGLPETEDALLAISAGYDVDERRATALLILTRLYVKAGRIDDAREIVARMPKQEAQHVRTIAERIVQKEL